MLQPVDTPQEPEVTGLEPGVETDDGALLVEPFLITTFPTFPAVPVATEASTVDPFYTEPETFPIETTTAPPVLIEAPPVLTLLETPATTAAPPATSIPTPAPTTTRVSVSPIRIPSGILISSTNYLIF